MNRRQLLESIAAVFLAGARVFPRREPYYRPRVIPLPLDLHPARYVMKPPQVPMVLRKPMLVKFYDAAVLGKDGKA